MHISLAHRKYGWLQTKLDYITSHKPARYANWCPKEENGPKGQTETPIPHHMQATNTHHHTDLKAKARTVERLQRIYHSNAFLWELLELPPFSANIAIVTVKRIWKLVACSCLPSRTIFLTWNVPGINISTHFNLRVHVFTDIPKHL